MLAIIITFIASFAAIVWFLVAMERDLEKEKDEPRGDD